MSELAALVIVLGLLAISSWLIAIWTELSKSDAQEWLAQIAYELRKIRALLPEERKNICGGQSCACGHERVEHQGKTPGSGTTSCDVCECSLFTLPEERHDFVGRLDRGCEVCKKPDRDPIHLQRGVAR
jgi:hypothetical protein